jgi:hypothetical protein
MFFKADSRACVNACGNSLERDGAGAGVETFLLGFRFVELDALGGK